MPGSPRTPNRPRRSSGFSIALVRTASHGSAYSANHLPHSRQSSMHSIVTPNTPRTGDRSIDYGLVHDLGGVVEAGNGLGSLADELAEDYWDETEELEGSVIDDSDEIEGGEELVPCNGSTGSPVEAPVAKLQEDQDKGNRSSSNSHGYAGTRDRALYVAPNIPITLEQEMSVINDLARQSTVSEGSEPEGVFMRVADQLRELGSQASIEGHTTRLATAHTALTTNLAHQARLLTTLTHPLTSPLALSPSSDIMDSLPSLLSSLVLLLPQPSTTSLSSIHALHATTSDLVHSLSCLSDNLQMSRQTTVLASRRLRAAREAVDAVRKELDQAEESIRWLEVEKWEQKLQNRHAAIVCGEVVSGFEELCSGWRTRLLEMTGFAEGVVVI